MNSVGRCCPGGFCQLVLPGCNHVSTGRENSRLSKSERRLQRSQERENATLLLQWVLKEDEFKLLKENGDLVRLNVKKEKKNDSCFPMKDELSFCVDSEAVLLARREYRPELARLSFAEYSSKVIVCDPSEANDLSNNITQNQRVLANSGSTLDTSAVIGGDGEVLVCNACATVYHLLEQARTLLHSSVLQDQSKLTPATYDTKRNLKNNNTDSLSPNNFATINQDNIGQLLEQNLKKSQMVSAQSDELAEGKQLAHMSSSSFHDEIKRVKEIPSEGKSVPVTAKRKMKNKDEEYSKISILIADSDEATTTLAKHLLEKEGFYIDTVANESECIELLEKTVYSLLLVNERLCGNETSTVRSFLRKKERIENSRGKLRVLIMVQTILEIDCKSYEELDIDGFVPIPLDSSRLIHMVKKTISQYHKSLHPTTSNRRLYTSKIVVSKKQDIINDSAQNQKNDSTLTHLKKPKKAKKSTCKLSQQTHLSTQREKPKQDGPITYESMFIYDEKTSFPYEILCGGVESRSESAEGQHWRNLIVCQDVFDTYERIKFFLLPMVTRYIGMKILLWNYPGQAYTSYSDESILNNKYHADCLFKLLEHVKGEGKGKFNLDFPFFILAHGSGAAIATFFAAMNQSNSLKGLIFVNGLSHIDSHYASVFHDCKNVFSCSPESRPDLPVYFYARYLFSQGYLSKTSSSLALNMYTAVHNPITLNGRKRLCYGVLNHVDTRPFLKDIASPIISIHGENATLVQVLHAAHFQNGRRCCATISQALRGGNRTTIIMMKGGHELFQEKKEQIGLLIEQILTGYHEKNYDLQPLDDAIPEQESLISSGSPHTNELLQQNTFEDHFIDNILKSTQTFQSSRGMNEEKIAKQPQYGSQDKAQSHLSTITTERQKGHLKGSIVPDTHEYPEVKEYMTWRVQRHKKRLLALNRSAEIVQRAFRCYMAKTMIDRVRKEKAAMFIQRCFRGFIGRKKYAMKKKELWAARMVQRILRGHRGRCFSYNKRLEKSAQINLARMIRGITARCRFNALLQRREKSAVKIQSAWRMHVAVLAKRNHRLRRYSAIVIQRLFRGHRGRKKAALERDKYIFSRSQSSGIDIGRQMLAEHKLHATKLQSEISLLNQEKDKIEKEINFRLSEISNFEQKISELEKKMLNLSTLEKKTIGILHSHDDIEINLEKRRLDEEFSQTLVKISDRKLKLEKSENDLDQLVKTRIEKFGQLKKLEGQLAVLLDTQDSALENIRRKKEQSIDGVMPLPPGSTPYLSSYGCKNMPANNRLPPKTDISSTSFSESSQKDKIQAAKLIDSTETMMKFGFMSMSLTYFSSLNMMRAMQQVVANDACPPPTPDETINCPLISNSHSIKRPFEKTVAVRVESWSVNDVSKWLSSISLSQYQSSFKEGAVDGSLLCELTDDDLKNTLGIEHRLHRKKILFSIQCLKKYNEEQSSSLTPSSLDQPQHSSTSSVKRFMPIPQNEAVYQEDVLDNNSRLKAPIAESPSKKTSVLDVLTPSTIEKHVVPLCDYDQLRSWLRHQKYENIQEALNNIIDAPFQKKHVRVQFIKEIGTSYTQSYEHEPFNLNRGDEHGNTLMHIAAQTGNVKVAKLLIRKGANPNHQNKQGQTPGHFAVAYQFFDFASWLFDEKGGGANDMLTNMYDLGPYDGLGGL